MSKRKLLLADDSITIQKVVNLTFADEGIEVISVGDGDSAMEKIHQSAPDLVLADVNMPGLSGYQICEQIKQNAATSKIPVILLVGSFEPFDEAEAYRVGADDYLTKPFQSIRQLVSKVSELLESANGEAPAPAIESPEIIIEETVDSDVHFIDTKEFPKDNAENVFQFDDSGTDDEMIQTNQIGSLPVDETQKYITNAPAEESEDRSISKPSYADFEKPRSFEASADFGQMQPVGERSYQAYTGEENTYFAEDNAAISNSAATAYDFAGENSIGDRQPHQIQADANENTPEIGQFQNEPETAAFETENDLLLEDERSFGDEKTPESEGEKSFEIAPPVTASALNFDDLDLLELPTFKPQTLIKNAVGTKTSETTAVKTSEKSGGERVNQFSRLSPEMIETIAQKVAEKISDKAIREIAWELVPQLTAAIIKKMEQEKPRE